MKGHAFINNKDIYVTWGAILVKGAYETLLKPSPNKQYIENKSRLDHGKSIIINSRSCKSDERDVTISFWITGISQNDYLTKYKSFTEEISSDLVFLKIPDLNTIFKLNYLNCSSFGDYGLKTGKLTVKFNEANIKDREVIW